MLDCFPLPEIAFPEDRTVGPGSRQGEDVKKNVGQVLTPSAQCTDGTTTSFQDIFATMLLSIRNGGQLLPGIITFGETWGLLVFFIYGVIVSGVEFVFNYGK